jgi:hypothetical protein
MVKGRSIFNSSKKGSNSRPYGGYAKHSTSRSQDPLEMSKPKKKVDVHNFTIHDRDESEESIVGREDNPGTTSSACQSASSCPSDGIIKTNAITITYDTVSDGPAPATKRWAAV